MNDNIRKGPILYHGMVRGRRKFLIINLIITVLYLIYIIQAMPYIVGKLHGPYEFDAHKFMTSTEDVIIEEAIEMKAREDKSIPSYADSTTSYMDGDKYRFNVKFDSFEPIGIEYTTEIEDPATNEILEFVMYSVYMGRIGDRVVPVMCNTDMIPDSNIPLTGIFREPAKVIVSDISKLTADGTEIVMNEYLFDARGIEMGVEDMDVGIMIIGFILLAFLYIRLIRYYINPYKHPTYKQLYKYGELEEVINDIEDQFESEDVFSEGKELICTDWIMTKDTFKNKVVRNHRTRGRYS